MKVGVAGAGAVGGYFGGMLQRAGHEVIFLARGAHLIAMQGRGLHVETEEGDFQVHGSFTEGYEDFADIDLVLFCVKSTDTETIAKKLVNIMKEDAYILTMQNGVDNEETLASVFGKERVLSAASYVQAFVKEPGVVKQIGIPPRLVIGALDSSGNLYAEKIVKAFNEAGVESKTSDQILARKWQKLLWNVTFNPLSAVIEAEVREIMDNAELKNTAFNICKEAVQVARESGVELPVDITETIVESGNKARNHKTSMLQDRLKGKKMEIDSICGYIVNRGKELNVDTPVLETIYHLLKFIDNKK